MNKNQPEFELQKSICRWLSIQHPKVLFLSDTIASVKLTIPQGNRNRLIQKNGFKTPDLIILQPNRNFCGLFIELKAKCPFKKDGTLLKDVHLEAQQKSIDDLNREGYLAFFSWDFDRTKQLIEIYLKDQ